MGMVCKAILGRASEKLLRSRLTWSKVNKNVCSLCNLYIAIYSLLLRCCALLHIFKQLLK